jgi:hypothetical protein
MNLTEDQSIFFRNEFRKAREKVIEDSENYSEILFCLEKFGSFLIKEISTLSKYQSSIQHFACESPLAKFVPDKVSSFHIPFYRLYQIVMQARNDALHQGAYARHLSKHAVELCIVLEDSLMSNLENANEIMVRDPICCNLWQPISLIRQQMLANSFSFLPFKNGNDEWHFVSDLSIAKFLAVKADQRKDRLVMSLSVALNQKTNNSNITGFIFESINAVKLSPVSSREEIISKLETQSYYAPVLITAKGGQEDLLGIITPFDLL